MFHTRLHVPIPARKSPVPCSPPFTQHAASPHAPRCINPPYSEPIFLPYEMPFPSCMLRCHRNLPALFVRFPPAARSSSSSRLLPPASRSALSSSSSCPLPGLEGIQKKPSGIALGGLLTKNGGYLLSHGCAVPSARAGLTSLFGMGRGGTPPFSVRNGKRWNPATIAT